MIKPLEDHVAIKVHEPAKKSPGGILMPTTLEKESQKGTVVAVGPGRHLESGQLLNMEVTVGDTVLFTRYGGSVISVGNQELKIMRQSELLAKE